MNTFSHFIISGPLTEAELDEQLNGAEVISVDWQDGSIANVLARRINVFVAARTSDVAACLPPGELISPRECAKCGFSLVVGPPGDGVCRGCGRFEKG